MTATDVMHPWPSSAGFSFDDWRRLHGGRVYDT